MTNNEQYWKDIIRYTRDEFDSYNDKTLEESRVVWKKKFDKNTCKRKIVKLTEIKELCDQLNIHLWLIEDEQRKRAQIAKQKAAAALTTTSIKH